MQTLMLQEQNNLHVILNAVFTRSWNESLCTISLKLLSHSWNHLYVFQEDARIHMIYKSFGREGLRNLFGGKMAAEWEEHLMGN